MNVHLNIFGAIINLKISPFCFIFKHIRYILNLNNRMFPTLFCRIMGKIIFYES